jgi:hypothetical protein
MVRRGDDMPDLITLTREELDALEIDYTWADPPPCRICSQPLQMTDTGGENGRARFACTSVDARLLGKDRDAFKRALRHYHESQWQQPRQQDQRVVAVIRELRELRAQSA